jgi:hypothetical protein
MIKSVCSTVLSLVAVFWARESLAAPSKEDCVNAHSQAQDLRDKSLLTQARRTFLICAQSTCPQLLQNDCSKMGEELERLQPSVTFAARDQKQNDLPNTQVFVDEKLVASRLDDGKSYDLDPGKHTVRFVNNGKESVVNTVVNQGEKGRTIVAVFGEIAVVVPTPSESKPASSTTAQTPPEQASKSVLPLVVAGVGVAALGTGIALGVVGLGKVPSECRRSDNTCAAAPDSAAFSDAKSAMTLANTGVLIAGIGAVALVSGVVWYLTSPSPSTPKQGSLWIRSGVSAVQLGGTF